MFEREILDLFNVMIVDKPSTTYLTSNAIYGFVTDFKPSAAQLAVLKDKFNQFDIKTLFTVEERNNASVEELISKQILHYIEVYGLGRPGLFNLEVDNGKIMTLNYVQGITLSDFKNLIQVLLYANAPIKDTVALKNIINAYNIKYDINAVENNELRVILFDVDNDVYDNGDDVVRYMCYKATGASLLIKSAKVIAEVKANRSLFSTSFFEKHDVVLAQVFNRHKNLILAAKTDENKAIINKISRMSKTKHVPVFESISKRFIADAMSGAIHKNNIDSVLSGISLREKFKFLNLLEYKKLQNSVDAFVIRNGRVHIEEGRKTYSLNDIVLLQSRVLQSIKVDLIRLRGKKIKLDKFVDYGLPISRKQTMGNLPFGTTCSVDGDSISSGIFWMNEWGATDLDLSTVDADGNRVGWGQFSGYNNSEIKFSGDVTSAPSPKGAMEFMTSSNTSVYGLFVNIFNGLNGCSAEIVVGNNDDKKWIKNVSVREKIKLASRGTIIGFVKNNKFVVYQTSMNDSHTSFGAGSSKNAAIVSRGLSDFWTVSRLFDELDIEYSVDNISETDYDLTYNQFSYDKLEALLLR